MILADRSSGYAWDYYLIDRSIPSIRTVLVSFIKIIEIQYSVNVKVFECNNEIIKIYP